MWGLSSTWTENRGNEQQALLLSGWISATNAQPLEKVKLG